MSLTYNGDTVYKTYFGAFVTGLILLAVFSFAGYKTNVLVNRINPDMATLNFVRDLSDSGIIPYQDYGFDLAFKLWSELDPSYGTFVYNHVAYVYEEDEKGNRNRIKIKTPLGMEKCSKESFNFPNKEALDIFGIDTYICAASKKFELAGNYYTEDF